MTDLVKEALIYRRSGFSVIVVSKLKRAIHYWKKYQKYLINKIKLERLLKEPNAHGVAIVCGPVSGNLEVIDIDEKNSPNKFLFKELLIKLDQKSPDLVARLVVASTKNKGFHLMYTCDKVDKYTALATRPCTPEELIKNPQQKNKVLIERKGTNGYVVVFPTPGYQFIQRDLYHLPHISEEERKLLENAARSFNLYKEVFKQVPKRRSLPLPPITARAGMPGDDYNKRGDIIGLLEKHGWSVVRCDGQKTHLQRPGDTDHDTSGDFHHEMGLFTLFTGNTEFEAYKGYCPFAVYAMLECNGDFRLAAKKLLGEGYGIPYDQQ